MVMNLSKLQEIVKDKKTWHAAAHEIAKSWTWLSDWTITTAVCQEPFKYLDIAVKKAEKNYSLTFKKW